MPFVRTERYSREELFEMVWSTPIDVLAKRFAMSGRGLAKLCKKHDIPVPERGWWAKHAAGKPVKRTPLQPPTQSKRQGLVEVHIREDPRRWLSSAELQHFTELIEAAKAREPITVPDRKTNRHPLLTAMRRSLKLHGGTASEEFDLHLSRTTASRALRILAAIFKECELLGYAVGVSSFGGKKEPEITVEGHRIPIKIETRSRRVTHVLTKKEREDRERWPHASWAPKYDYVPSKRLFLVIDDYTPFDKKTFADSEKGSVEAQLNDFFVTLLRFAMVRRAEKNRRELERQTEEKYQNARAEEERIRRETQKKAAADRRRRRVLIVAAEKFRRANDLMAMVAAVQEIASSEQPNSEAVASRVEYATSVAQDLNPVQELVAKLLRTP